MLIRLRDRLSATRGGVSERARGCVREGICSRSRASGSLGARCAGLWVSRGRQRAPRPSSGRTSASRAGVRSTTTSCRACSECGCAPAKEGRWRVSGRGARVRAEGRRLGRRGRARGRRGSGRRAFVGGRMRTNAAPAVCGSPRVHACGQRPGGVGRAGWGAARAGSCGARGARAAGPGRRASPAGSMAGPAAARRGAGAGPRRAGTEAARAPAGGVWAAGGRAERSVEAPWARVGAGSVKCAGARSGEWSGVGVAGQARRGLQLTGERARMRNRAMAGRLVASAVCSGVVVRTNVACGATRVCMGGAGRGGQATVAARGPPTRCWSPEKSSAIAVRAQ